KIENKERPPLMLQGSSALRHLATASLLIPSTLSGFAAPPTPFHHFIRTRASVPDNPSQIIFSTRHCAFLSGHRYADTGKQWLARTAAHKTETYRSLCS